ncbi:MAG: PilZ domain-containing protein [Pseudomonadota bacterium]
MNAISQNQVPKAFRSDRRTHRRTFANDLRVDLVHSNKEIGGCRALDISEGGLRIEALGAPVDSVVNVLIQLPVGPAQEKRPCLIKSKVAWRTIHCTGLRFLNLSPSMVSCLKRYM